MSKGSTPRIISIILGGIIIAFLLHHSWKYWDLLQNERIAFKWQMLILAYIIGVGSFLFYSLGWFWLLKGEKKEIRFWEANYLLTKGNLGKYIPGRVWQFLGRLYLFNHLGIPKSKIIMISILEQYFLMFSAFLFFAFSFFLYQELYANWIIWKIDKILIAGLIVGAGTFHPRMFILWNRISKKFLKERLRLEIISYERMCFLLLVYLAYWIMSGLSLVCLMKSGISLKWNDFFFILGAEAIAYVIGYLALITPSGLGVREGVLTYLLELVFAKGLGSIIAIGSRLLFILQEIGYFLLSLLFCRLFRSPNAG